MNHLVTPGFLFRWSFPVVRMPDIPGPANALLNLPEACRLPSVNELNGQVEFADVRIAWNPGGLGISVDVRGRLRKPICDEMRTESSDGITVWIDTRNTQGVHRATRFCHQFCLMPTSTTRGRGPVVVSIPLARAREESVALDLSSVRLNSAVVADGYRLEAWFPADVFIGFDPATAPRFGFHYRVHDNDLGEQFLAVSSEFPVASDPSLWQTLELQS